MKKIITTTGFGHSGSGTLIDFFSEFDNSTVLGYHDVDGSKFKASEVSEAMEVDFIRRANGVFDLERICSIREVSCRDVAVKSFITLMEYFYSSKSPFYDDEFLKITEEFIEELVEFKITSRAGFVGHWHLEFEDESETYPSNLHQPFIHYVKHDRKLYNRYFLKDLTVQEYRNLAKKYIHKALSRINSKEFLVLDNFIADSCKILEMFMQREICSRSHGFREILRCL